MNSIGMLCNHWVENCIWHLSIDDLSMTLSFSLYNEGIVRMISRLESVPSPWSTCQVDSVCAHSTVQAAARTLGFPPQSSPFDRGFESSPSTSATWAHAGPHSTGQLPGEVRVCARVYSSRTTQQTLLCAAHMYTQTLSHACTHTHAPLKQWTVDTHTRSGTHVHAHTHTAHMHILYTFTRAGIAQHLSKLANYSAAAHVPSTRDGMNTLWPHRGREEEEEAHMQGAGVLCGVGLQVTIRTASLHALTCMDIYIYTQVHSCHTGT